MNSRPNNSEQGWKTFSVKGQIVKILDCKCHNSHVWKNIIIVFIFFNHLRMYKPFLACGLSKNGQECQLWSMGYSLLTTALNPVLLTLVLYLTAIDISNWHFLNVCTVCDISTLKNYEEEIYNHHSWWPEIRPLEHFFLYVEA